jgi:glycerol-3-phosphate dehydrogenase (NAD(P)+)
MGNKISVLGAGSWGATLANLLAENGHVVSLWEFDPAAEQTLRNSRRLSILPELLLNSKVQVTNDLAECLRTSTTIISATPSHVVRATMKAAAQSKAVMRESMVVSVSKGLEAESLKPLNEIISEELHLPGSQITVLSGPSHAEEVVRRLPTATVLASRDADKARYIPALFANDYFRVYSQSDILGVELGGALKNVYAIACGISDGLGFGDNTRAALLSRGLNEMARIGVKMGAQLLTFFGLAGMGDLIVTCLSQHSRNYSLGLKIGQGKSPKQALAEMTMVAEGMKMAPSAHALAKKLDLDCPLIREVYHILYESKDPKQSLHDLMRRETESEWQGLQ